MYEISVLEIDQGFGDHTRLPGGLRGLRKYTYILICHKPYTRPGFPKDEPAHEVPPTFQVNPTP